MAVKVADTIEPLGQFPAMMGNHLELTKEDGSTKSIQAMYDDGELGGGRAIVDVNVLPVDDIDEDVLYRLTQEPGVYWADDNTKLESDPAYSDYRKAFNDKGYTCYWSFGTGYGQPRWTEEGYNTYKYGTPKADRGLGVYISDRYMSMLSPTDVTKPWSLDWLMQGGAAVGYQQDGQYIAVNSFNLIYEIKKNNTKLYHHFNGEWHEIGEGGGDANLPPGGTTGQALVKASDADNDVEWGDVLAGVDFEYHEDDKEIEFIGGQSGGGEVPTIAENGGLEITPDNELKMVSPIEVQEVEGSVVDYIPRATTEQYGVVKAGSNINVSNGVFSVPAATTGQYGVVKLGVEVDTKATTDAAATKINTLYPGLGNLVGKALTWVSPTLITQAQFNLNQLGERFASASFFTAIEGTTYLTNAPFQKNPYHWTIIQLAGYGTNRCTQIAIYGLNNNGDENFGAMWLRSRHDSTWSAWRKL